MTEPVLIAMISATPPTLAALAAWIMDIRNHRVGRRNEKMIREIHVVLKNGKTLKTLLDEEKD